MECKLFKKKSTYVDKEGKEKNSVQFYLSCGSSMIPIEVTFFKNKETGNDNQYSNRKSILSAFAEDLPDKS